MMMRTIIAGSRDIEDLAVIEAAIKDSNFQITEVVSGGARGVDRLGEHWAADHDVPVKRFSVNWMLGRGAGYVRNKDMAQYAEALVAIWDGISKGTKHMIDTARKHNLKVHVLIIRATDSPDYEHGALK